MENIIIKRGFNFIAACFNYLRWRWRFKDFGWRSRLGGCDHLTGSKGISIGKSVTIRKGARLEAFDVKDCGRAKLIIGDGTSIHYYFHCGAAERVSIGKDVLIAGRVYISDHDHDYSDVQKCARRSDKLISKSVSIGDGAWLGEGCVILKGVSVGERSVIGANSVVTKDVPAWSVACGVPAKVIKKIEADGVGG